MEDRIRVLVVDDEEVIRLGYRRVLSGDSFSVMSAGGGTEALELMADKRFDVVSARSAHARDGRARGPAGDQGALAGERGRGGPPAIPASTRQRRP